MTGTPELCPTVLDHLELYRRMWVLRLVDMAVEESRIDGVLPHSVQPVFGQEAFAVGTTAACRPGDVIATTLPHVRQAEQVSLALPLGRSIAELIGSSLDDGVREHGQGVAHWKQSLSAASPLGRSTLFALGDAYAQSLAGEGRVTLCVISDGDARSPGFTAAANVAASWGLPVVFVVEDIRGESGVGADGHHAMPALSADGRDVEAVRDSVTEGVRRASEGEGPTVVTAITHRTNHPSGVDPLVFARRRLTGIGVAGDRLYEVERRARRLVAEAETVVTPMLRARKPASGWAAWPAAN